MSQEDYFAEEFIIFNRCLMIVLEFMSFGFVWWCFPISCYNLHVLTVRCGKIPHVYFGKKESWSHFKLNVPSEMSKNAANLSEVWQMWPKDLCMVWVGHDASTLFEFTDARTAPSNAPWRTELVTRKPIGCGFFSSVPSLKQKKPSGSENGWLEDYTLWKLTWFQSYFKGKRKN